MRGLFDFTTSKGEKLSGKICSWSLNRFCEKYGGLTVTELFSAITTGVSIKAVADILLCSVEYMHKGKDFNYTVDDAMDWIDDIGGVGAAVSLIEKSVATEDKGKKKAAAKSR